MSPPKFRAYPRLLFLTLVGTTLWSACQSVEDASTSFENLASATTVDQAERAITDALMIAGVGDISRPSGYSGYVIGDEALQDLSEELAAYNSTRLNSGAQTRTAGSSLRSAFDLAQVTHRPTSVNLDDDLEITLTAGNLALVAEEPNQALLYALVGDGVLPAAFGPLDPDASISPFQEYMYYLWLQHKGPGLLHYNDVRDQLRISGKALGWEVPICNKGKDELLSSETDSEGQLNSCLNNPNCEFGTCDSTPEESACEEGFGQCIWDNQHDESQWPLCESERTECLAAIHDSGGG